jgi:hypothetical protein
LAETQVTRVEATMTVPDGPAVIADLARAGVRREGSGPERDSAAGGTECEPGFVAVRRPERQAFGGVGERPVI